MVNNKKVKLDPSINNTKKKQIQPVVKTENPTKTIVNTKKSKLVSHKSSSVLDEKTPKTKELNQTLNVHKNTDSKNNPRTLNIF
jgi:phage FluMu protein Com